MRARYSETSFSLVSAPASMAALMSAMEAVERSNVAADVPFDRSEKPNTRMQAEERRRTAWTGFCMELVTDGFAGQGGSGFGQHASLGCLFEIVAVAQEFRFAKGRSEK